MSRFKATLVSDGHTHTEARKDKHDFIGVQLKVYYTAKASGTKNK